MLDTCFLKLNIVFKIVQNTQNLESVQ